MQGTSRNLIVDQGYLLKKERQPRMRLSEIEIIFWKEGNPMLPGTLSFWVLKGSRALVIRSLEA